MPDKDYTRCFSAAIGPQYHKNTRQIITADQCSDNGIDVSFDISRTSDGCKAMSLTVTNGSKSELSEVIFPDIELDPKRTGSGFTLPVGPGWWQPFDPLEEGEHINFNYPVYGSMQWLDYCDDESGFYVGVHDTVPYIKIFTIGKRNGRPWIRIRFTDIHLMPGETFKLPPVVFCKHNGNWREGARIYRRWAESWMEKPFGAGWYDEAPAWSWLGMKNQHAEKPDRLFSDVPAETRRRADYGVKVSNMASWVEHGHDTHYPDYVAADCMGGENALIKAVDEVHSNHLRICLYTNGRIVDPQGSIGKIDGWQEWAVHSPDAESLVPMEQLHANFIPQMNPVISWNTDGTVVTEGYGKVDFAVMCPGCREWRDLFVKRMEYMAATYKVNGTFIDQINGCWALPCYSGKHDHKRPNESWSGYLTLLRDLRKTLRSINPEFLMSTEGVCDIFGQFFDVQQGHNDWDTQVGTKSRPMPELYSYTFPWYVVNTGYASHNNYYYLKLAHAVGSGLDVCAVEPDKLEKRFLHYLKLIMRWRGEYGDVLRGGEFLGALRCSSPHYLAHAFRKDERLLITAAWVPYKCNPDKPEYVNLEVEGFEAREARLFTEDGEGEAGVKCEGGVSVITVPVSEIAVVAAGVWPD